MKTVWGLTFFCDFLYIIQQINDYFMTAPNKTVKESVVSH